MGKPPVVASLTWQDDLRFSATSGQQTMTLDSDGNTGPSPMQALAVSIASCMAMDVVDIIKKGRHPLRGLTAQIVGDRAQSPPHRLLRVNLAFVVEGDVPGVVIERAIALSHDKYCSVSNSLRTDIEFVTAYEVKP